MYLGQINRKLLKSLKDNYLDRGRYEWGELDMVEINRSDVDFIDNLIGVSMVSLLSTVGSVEPFF